MVSVHASNPIAFARDGSSPLQVLLVEDNDVDAMIAQAAVEKAVRGPCEIRRAATLGDGLALVDSPGADIVLLDLNLPDSHGVETLKRMRLATTCPIIVVTVQDGPGLDEEVLGNGAFEILHKDRLGPDTIVRLLRLAEDRRRAQGSIEDAEHRFRRLTELTSDWYWEQDAQLRLTFLSEGFAEKSGAARDKRLGQHCWDEPERSPLVGTWEEHRALLMARKPFRNLEFVRRDAHGARRFQSVTGEPFFDKAGNFAGYRGTSRDITERKLAEEARDRSHARLELALAASRVCTWDYDIASGEVVLSESWAGIIGAAPGETRTSFQSLLELVHQEDIAALHAVLIEVVKGTRDAYAVEHRVRHQNGEWCWIVSRGKVVTRDARGRAVRIVGTNLDISERVRSEAKLRESEARFRSLTELSSDWYWEQDEQFRFTYVSPGYSARLGGNPAKAVGRRRWEIDTIVPASGTWAEHRALLEAHQPFRDFEQIRTSADGSRQFVSSSGTPVYDVAGKFTGYHGVSSNITARKDAEKRLVYLAQFDAVTGLPNHSMLQEKLDHTIVQSRRRGRGAGVLFIDLDRFKLVNDSLGHKTGDALLSQVGKRLGDCVRPDDAVGRLAGDEFAVVIADLAQPEDAAIVAQKILDSFAAAFVYDGQQVYLTASIGVATSPDDGDKAESLLKCADTAMYRAKELLHNSFRFYTPEMDARTAAKLQLSTDLRRAVRNREFRLYYQPKVSLATRTIVGMEALLRWQHPERGLVPPMEFIPALEDTGLIVVVGDWVVEEACRQLRDWTRAGLAPLPIAVNLSALQFRRRDLDSVIRGIVAGHGLQPGLLELEITESSLMHDPVDAIRQLHALREAGLRISVDDFGTGYSSLSYLTRLPLSTLKIDRSFVNAAVTEASSASIVRMVIDMAQNLGFNVVAEGIESEQHVDFLRRHGCEQGQGYLFGVPAPAQTVQTRLLRRVRD